MMAGSSFLHNVPGMRILLLGPPAAGKGTLCEQLCGPFGLVHISTGDILRAAIRAGNAELKQYVDNGRLVPDDVVTKVVVERLNQSDCQRRGWVLDGFPRTAPQAQALAQSGVLSTVDVVVLLDVADKELLSRVTGRRIDPVTNAVYHIPNRPPPNDPTIRARLIQRADDTEVKAAERIATYYKHVIPILAHCEKVIPRAVHKIDGNKGSEVVAGRLLDILRSVITVRTANRGDWKRSYGLQPSNPKRFSVEYEQRAAKYMRRSSKL